ncbi:MAG: amino acid transporter [Planctomycetota bacterium]|nr:MAG: amino acid transporter [Planctomycetota bacterium]
MSGRRPLQLEESRRLKKELGLFDVYVIATGAMFSSGFFLLPGIAAAHTGPSVILAYLLSGLLIVPAMLSMAELATAMPRAGGAYFFLDRAMGPLLGTIGGAGTWFALVFKSGFAVLGIGYYLDLFLPDVPVLALAFGATAVFAALNILGARQTSGLQRLLVTVMIAILVGWLVEGLADVLRQWDGPAVRARMSPFLPFGIDGLLATVGMVFVSYMGLTKVASIAEEVEDPDRNIPLGMFLSLGTAIAIYVLGVLVMVGTLEPEQLRASRSPVTDAAQAFVRWVPQEAALVALVVAAIAAFASTANAGIMSAARYVLAMARDRLVPERLGRLGRFRTPTLATVLTAGAIAAFLLLLDVEAVAKLASAFQLLIFALVCAAVIVMRESRILAYDPGFRSPLYPWMQIAGMVVPLFLIAEMGWLPVLFTLGVSGACVAWYVSYAAPRVVRSGAIFHLFARLGKGRFEGLDIELRGILGEKGLREEDPYDEVVARAFTLELGAQARYADVALEVARLLSERIPADPRAMAAAFVARLPGEADLHAPGVALPHVRLPEARHPELVLARCREGMRLPGTSSDPAPAAGGEGSASRGEPDARARPQAGRLHALIFLASPADNPGQHLRLLAQIAGSVSREGFLPAWLGAERPQQLRETLLRDERFLSLWLRRGTRAEALIGLRVREIDKPDTCLLAVIRRGSEVLVPRSGTVLEEGDRITFIGEPEDIETLYDRYTGGG